MPSMPPTAASPREESTRPADRPAAWRLVVASLAVIAALTVTAAVFWEQDLQYSLPTPVPADWTAPAIGTDVLADNEVAALRAHHRGRPLLVHSFAPSCPCSRFNADHVRALMRTFADRVDFVALVQCTKAGHGLESFDEQDLDIQALADVDGRIARALGVYATPQAVLLDRDGHLVYRGNYNVSRYCVDRSTEFARLAVEALLAGRAPLQTNAAAEVAYGCSLPADVEPASPR